MMWREIWSLMWDEEIDRYGQRNEKMAIHIVMVNPEIPPNTGNVARSCAATDSVLHLVKPLGFSIDDRHLKRAGLDYWPYVRLEVHDSLSQFLDEYKGRRMYLATTKGGQLFTDVSYQDEDMILFGCETKGLERDFIAEHAYNYVKKGSRIAVKGRICPKKDMIGDLPVYTNDLYADRLIFLGDNETKEFSSNERPKDEQEQG